MYSFTIFAQVASDLPQLKNQLSGAKTSKEKIELLNKIALVYSKSDSVNTFLYANQAIVLANKTGDIAAKGKSYYVQALLYHNKVHMEKAIELYQIAAELQKKASNKDEYAKALTSISKCYIGISKYEQAIPYIQESINIHKQLNNKIGLIVNYNDLGVINNSLGKKDVAIANYLYSLEIINNIKDQPGLAPVQLNIATLYSDIGQFEKARKFFVDGIQKADEVKDDFNKYMAMSNLGNMCMQEKKYAEATKLMKECGVYYEKVKMKYGLFITYNNLGAIQIRQENYAASIPLLKQSLANIHPKDKTNLVISQQNIAYAYTMLHNYSEAEKWFALAETEVAQGGITPYAMGELYNHRATLDSLKGDYQKALEHKNKFYALSNNQLNEKISKQINELQTKYETSKKEKQISLLNKENDIKALQLNNNALEISRNKSLLTAQDQQLTINGLELANKNQIVANQKLDTEKKTQNIKALEKQSRIQNLELQNKKLELEQRNLLMGSGFILFLALGGISFSFYKRNQLKQQNLLQTEIYKQQEIATKSVFEGEQNERIRIARDLHDGIGQMLSVVKMNVSTLPPDNKTVENTLNLVDKTITELRSISHNLIPEALNFGLFAALEDICQKINSTGKTKATLNVEPSLQVQKLSQQNELSIYRIVQEVLNNMIKHANANSISLNIEKVSANMLITIKDDGKGFDAAKINESKGIGWKNILARVNLMDGEMKIESEQLIGTQIEISIPTLL